MSLRASYQLSSLAEEDPTTGSNRSGELKN